VVMFLLLRLMRNELEHGGNLTLTC